nr:hypothetical protein Iba_scaffold4931CG0070 [Ipomoea batatas]
MNITAAATTTSPASSHDIPSLVDHPRLTSPSDFSLLPTAMVEEWTAAVVGSSRSARLPSGHRSLSTQQRGRSSSTASKHRATTLEARRWIVAVAEIEARHAAWRKRMAVLTVPGGSSPIDACFFCSTERQREGRRLVSSESAAMVASGVTLPLRRYKATDGNGGISLPRRHEDSSPSSAALCDDERQSKSSRGLHL